MSARTRLIGAWVVVASVCGAALAQEHQGAPDVAAATTQAAPVALKWPDRVAIAGHDGARGIVRPVDAPDGLTGYQPSPFAPLNKPEGEDRADGEAVAGTRRFEMEGMGCFAFRPTPQARISTRHPKAERYFKFVSGRDTAVAGDPAPGPIEIQRTWFGYYPSTDAEKTRGVILVMPGLFNTPEPVIDYVVNKARARGWAVLRMMAQSSRFTERKTFKIDAGHLDDAASKIGAEMQGRAAECAFAVQSAFEHLLTVHPELAKLPRIALGMSGGAMSLPTVVALEPQKYAAAVLVAGGADFYQIAVESNYRHLVDSIDFEWATPPTAAQQETLDKLYLQREGIDSYHTAPLLAGKPLLMIHGTHDGAVPAHLGDLLWERLGKPERWSEESGHEEVFAHLPRNTDKVFDWVDSKLTPGPAPTGAPAATP